MPESTDIRPVGASLWYLPLKTRVPLKFGGQVVTHLMCARVRVTVQDAAGRQAEGWGETPLSVTWVWPSQLGYEQRFESISRFCQTLTQAYASFDTCGHPMEVGHAFLETRLPSLLETHNAQSRLDEPMPYLAALLCCSMFDIAIHDAFGKLHGVPTYQTYNSRYMNRDLASYLHPAEGANVNFAGKYPQDFLLADPPATLPAWHLVGGVDLLDDSERTGSEPDDGYPVVLGDWIRRDGIDCLKIKLTGTDAAWDYDRIVRCGQIAIEHGANWLTTDFNCTVQEPNYVNAILDRLVIEQPRIAGMILYVEQPFPYELEHHRIDVRSVSARKPLFMDESAHDWKQVRLGRSLGWTGVALKTCKTQTGALLSACWAKAHGMTLMVQDLTNPMLAMIPHVLLAQHVGTIMGVETNAVQFYPQVSAAEAKVHPNLYERRGGVLDLSTIQGPGFGYRLDEINRTLDDPVCQS